MPTGDARYQILNSDKMFNAIDDGYQRKLSPALMTPEERAELRRTLARYEGGIPNWVVERAQLRT